MPPDRCCANANRSSFPIDGWVGLSQPWHVQYNGCATYSCNIPYDESFVWLILHPYSGFVRHPTLVALIEGSIYIAYIVGVRLSCHLYLVFVNKPIWYEVSGGSWVHHGSCIKCSHHHRYLDLRIPLSVYRIDCVVFLCWVLYEPCRVRPSLGWD